MPQKLKKLETLPFDTQTTKIITTGWRYAMSKNRSIIFLGVVFMFHTFYEIHDCVLFLGFTQVMSAYAQINYKLFVLIDLELLKSLYLDHNEIAFQSLPSSRAEISVRRSNNAT